MRAILLLLFASPLWAQVDWKEDLRTGTSYRFDVSMQLSGAMTFDRNGRKESMPIEAVGRHLYVERIDSALQTHRHYFEAKSSTTTGLDRGEKSLPENKRFFVVGSEKDTVRPQTNSPLTREELSLVAEHFDALRVAGLLPGQSVKVNESWPIRDDVVMKLCLFEGIVKNELKGTLTNAETFKIDGAVEGLEHGAKVKLTIQAEGTYDVKNRIISKIVWNQTDTRAEGPVSPAMEARVKIVASRSREESEPKEVSAELRAGLVPSKNQNSPTADLSYTHPNGQFSLRYGREWFTVVQSETHLVLRLVIRGELIAQTTITPWKKTDPARSRAEMIQEFDHATAKQPGWALEKEIFNKDEGTGDSPRVYSRVMQGKQDDLSVLQHFQLITAADGRQVVLTCVMRPEMADKLGDHLSRIAPTLTFTPVK